MFSGQQEKCSQMNHYCVMTYILHKGAAESNKCPPPNIILYIIYCARTQFFLSLPPSWRLKWPAKAHWGAWMSLFSGLSNICCRLVTVWMAPTPFSCHYSNLFLSVYLPLPHICQTLTLTVVAWPDSRGISSRHPAYSFYMKGSSGKVSNMEANWYSFLHVNASHGCSTQAQDFMHSHTNTHTQSPKSLVVCCVPGRSRRKFHALLHTENVSFILPTEKGRTGNEWLDLRKKKKAKWGWLTCAGVTRCHGTPSKAKAELVTGSLECDVCDSRTQ